MRIGNSWKALAAIAVLAITVATVVASRTSRAAGMEWDGPGGLRVRINGS